MTFAVSPQPMTLVIKPTATKHSEKTSSELVKPLNCVFRPILAKNTGQKIIYELTSILRSIYFESSSELRIIPAT